MSKSGHNPNSGQFTQNQNNQMSDDPGDGSRNSFTARPESRTPVEKSPEEIDQDEDRVEALGRKGAGKA